MADQEPPENNSIEASDAGGRNLLGLPAKIRVHALAKLLGLTSKQVIAKAAERGTELRSAHSTLPRDVAEDLAHPEAARRLREMADVYEARAARLDSEGGSLKPSHQGHSRLAGANDRES